MSNMTTPLEARDGPQFREMAFAVSPEDLNLNEDVVGPVWGTIVEFGYPDCPVTLVVFADGSISLYIGERSGFIGAGTHESIRRTGKKLLELSRSFFLRSDLISAPLISRFGEVQFYFRTFKGLYGISVDEKALDNGCHEFSPLFIAAHNVITEIRLQHESDKPENGEKGNRVRSWGK